MRAPAQGVRRAILAVLACFVAAGALAPLWDRAASAYTGALVVACRPVVAWIEPAPLLDRLESTGTMVQLAGRQAVVRSLGAVETRTIFFYLPFVVLLLGAALRPLRLVTCRDMALILGSLFVVHAACLALGVQVLVVDALRAGGSPSLASPIENAILRTLHHTYSYAGAQLWAGLVIALVLLRAGAARGPDDASRPGPARPGVVAAACGVLLLPAVLYIALSPVVRQLTEGDRRARRIVALACLRAGELECARTLAAQALDAARPDPGTMMLLGLATERSAPAEAADWYRRVVEARPRFLDARIRLARMQASLGEGDAAIDGYYAVLSMAPGNVDAFRALGDLYLDRGDAEAARTHYEMAERLRPAAVATGAPAGVPAARAAATDQETGAPDAD